MYVFFFISLLTLFYPDNHLIFKVIKISFSTMITRSFQSLHSVIDFFLVFRELAFLIFMYPYLKNYDSYIYDPFTHGRLLCPKATVNLLFYYDKK